MATEIQKNKLIKLLCAVGMCIFCLFSVVTGTVAWFIANTNVQNTADEFPVEVLDNNVSKIEFHEFTGEVTQGGNTYYTFSTSKTGNVVIDDGDASQTGSMTMGKYKIDDEHHPVLILLELTSNASASIGARTSSNYIASSGYTMDSSSGHPLSSVVEFFSFTYSSTASDATSLASRTITVEGNQRYALKTNEFVKTGANKNRSSFVEIENGEYVDPMNDNISLFNGSTTGLAYLGIVIDYYPESIAYIYSYYLGNTYVSGGLSFTCDWTMTL